jgi:hypothetical protein
MKKLKLDLDVLAVSSFATQAADETAGTVQGHDIPTTPWCAGHTVKSYCPDSLCTCPPPID